MYNIINMQEHIIHKKYVVQKLVQSGNFGTVYKGYNMRTNEQVAIKTSVIKNGINLLKNEATIYKLLKDLNGVPNIKWYGCIDGISYIVINWLGESLYTLKTLQIEQMKNLAFILQIGINIVNILKNIHNNGFIHRDIKPDNIMIDFKLNEMNIHIIDFGLCKPYLNNNVHIPIKKVSGLIGSNNYASVNAHKFVELSRRDDLESVCYILLFLYSELMWQNVVENNVIFYLKNNLTFEANSYPLEIINVLKYIRSLQYLDTPDYEYITNILRI